jgi:hypothetical protein
MDKKQKAPNLVVRICLRIYFFLNPMLSIEIHSILSDFIYSQLQTEDTIPLYRFPNFCRGCFAPVVHQVMHIGY